MPIANRSVSSKLHLMFKNIVTVALRNLLKQRFYSLLNIAGLGIGLAVFLLIILFVGNELSYDRYHPNADRLYRIDQTFIWGDAYPTFGSTSPGVAFDIKAEVPGVEKVTRVYTVGEKVVSVPSLSDKVAYEEEGVLAADSTFFDVFNFPVVSGDGRSLLLEPFSVVLTETAARKYFGEAEALGESIRIADGKNDGLYKVTGIMKDVPVNSHFTFNMVTSMNSYQEVIRRNDDWIWTGFVTYVLLKEGAHPEAVQELIYDMPSRQAGDFFKDVTGGGKEWHLYLVPVTDIWLHSVNAPNRLGATSNILYVYVLSAIAVMVLALACVNYMNMATARSVTRTKEVGIRKTLGALKGHLLLQFLCESFILVLLASAFALGIVELSIPYFNTLAGVQLSTLSLFDSYTDMLMLGLVVLVTALLAGTYPAFYMSRFKPIQALRKQNKTGKGGRYLRSGLVVFQFTISISLVVLSFIVYDQLNYLQKRDTGFDKNNLVIVPQVQRMDSAKRVSFSKAIANNPAVKSVGMSTSVPPVIYDGDSFTSDEISGQNVPLSYMNVDKTYLETLGVEILYGRGFGEGYEGDRTNVVINEQTIVALGWTNDESVIGKKLIYYGDQRATVIGVMKNFNFWALNSPIEPLVVFQYGAPIFHQNSLYLSVRLASGANNVADVQQFISALEAQWDEFAPGLPFSYSFTDEMFFRAFEFEQRLGKIFSTFTYLAIIIACMGLLGLAAYMAETRIKEIGIRKVLGASVNQLVMLMSKDFAKLVIIAIVISIPLSWWAGNVWLQNYEYRTTISWLVFLYAGVSALVLALVTVSYQSIKTAFTNPVDVLHDE